MRSSNPASERAGSVCLSDTTTGVNRDLVISNSPEIRPGVRRNAATIKYSIFIALSLFPSIQCLSWCFITRYLLTRYFAKNKIELFLKSLSSTDASQQSNLDLPPSFLGREVAGPQHRNETARPVIVGVRHVDLGRYLAVNEFRQACFRRFDQYHDSSTGLKKCECAHWATCSPCRRPSLSANRKWIP